MLVISEAGAAGATTGRASAMVFMNGGTGNGVILAPLLAELQRRRPELEYLTSPNAALAADWIRSAVGLRGPADRVPSIWRRFAPSDRSSLWDFVDGNHVELVVNLRLESPEHDQDYFDFRSEASGRGIECWDLHEGGPQVGGSRIGERSAQVLRAHGVEVDRLRPAWLSQWRRPRSGVAGLYLGASMPVKRWPPTRWIELASALQGLGWLVEAAVGAASDEQALLAGVVDEVAGVAGHRPDSLSGLRDWLAGLEVLVSNDTLAVHLGAAIGVPVVGLYLATDAAIWSPRAEPGRFHALQSALGLTCSLAKSDGTCRRFYHGCPAPCRDGIRTEDVVAAVGSLVSAMQCQVVRPGVDE